jgi:hypothetical protein
MRFNKPVLITFAAFSITAAAVGFSVPALADTPKTAATTSQISVKVDAAHHEATVITTKRGTFTINWESFKGGKADLVTVHNDKDQLVAARKVSAKRFDKVVAEAKNHPRALLRVWSQHHKAKSAAKKATTGAKSS